VEQDSQSVVQLPDEEEEFTVEIIQIRKRE
jgi:hypothetical protein